MAFLRSQFIAPMFTGIPSDVITNTMHWSSDGIDTDAASILIANRLSDFYDLVYQISGSAANYVDWSQAKVRVYDLADPEPRAYSEQSCPVTPLSAGGANIATEVAVVMSYYAAPESGTPAARLRNRIYLGGLGNSAFSVSAADAYPTVAPAFRVDVLDAAEGLHTANDASLEWVQHSAVGLIAARPIVGAWVDNSPDTQRRRSVLASARSVRTF